MIKLKCPECDSDKVIFVPSELNEEDCFECEECNVVYPLSEMGWESERFNQQKSSIRNAPWFRWL